MQIRLKSDKNMEHFSEDPGTLYCCRRHKFSMKPILPIFVKARSETWFCGHSNASIAVSNMVWGLDDCLLLALCVVR